MGEKRESIRTLDNGSKVRHFPPDEQHPHGKMILIQESSPLKDRLEARREDNQRRYEQLQAQQSERIQVKKDRQSEKGLPNEKGFF